MLCYVMLCYVNKAFQNYANLKSLTVCVWLAGLSLTALLKFTEVLYILYLWNADTNQA